jgi:anti-anti-sigma factor
MSQARSNHLSTQRRGGVVWATLERESAVDQVVVAQVEREVRELLDEQPGRLVLDLSRLRWVSSPMVGMLVNVKRGAMERGATIALSGVQPSVWEVIKQLRVDRLFELEPAPPAEAP